MKYSEKIAILCVDDETNVLRALQRIFLDDDYEIRTATSGEEGLEILENNGPYQIVITDYRMPVMDGGEFLRAVYDRWPHTVRIVLSGYADVGSIVEAINDGQIYKFIAKPWNEDDLRDIIDSALERYFLLKRNRELMVELTHVNEKLEMKVQKRTAELQLRNQALGFSQNMLHSLPIGLVGIDSAGIIVQSNRKALQIFSAEDGVLGSDRRVSLPAEFNRIIDTLVEEGTSRQAWSCAGTDYEVRFATVQCFNQLGVVILLMDKLL